MFWKLVILLYAIFVIAKIIIEFSTEECTTIMSPSLCYTTPEPGMALFRIYGVTLYETVLQIILPAVITWITYKIYQRIRG